VTSPLVVFFAYTTVTADGALIATMVAVVASSWLVLGAGLAWARAGGRSEAEKGSMVLGTALGNTGFVGFPLAVLAFGPQGLALAVVYSEFQFLIPVLAVSVGIARRFAGATSCVPPAPGLAFLLRSWVINPPVVAGIIAIALRVAGADLAGAVTPIGAPVGLAIGLFGFLQLGLATPLERISHTAADLWRAGGTLALRCVISPLVLYVIARAAGLPLPPVFLLLAATPVAFHTMVLARVYGLDQPLQRLLIIVSTPAVIAAVLLWHALLQ
jgi:hypothetical protein